MESEKIIIKNMVAVFNEMCYKVKKQELCCHAMSEKDICIVPVILTYDFI